MPQLRAGVARCDITPPIGIAHGNWSAQVHERAEGVDLPLWCTALAVTDGGEEVILAEWDLLYPPDGEWLAECRRRVTDLTGVPGSHIRISASHTHAGPNLRRPWFEAGAEMIGPYVASLTDRLAGVCLAAHRGMQPARVAGGKGVCKVNANRRMTHPHTLPLASDGFNAMLYSPSLVAEGDGEVRIPGEHNNPLMAPNPDGFADHSVGVIRVDTLDGRPLAILVNFAAHPTILSWHNRLISPDYPGTLRRTVESLTGATCLFLQGAAGNQDTIRDYGNRVEDARWIGRQIGLEAVRVAEFIETQPTTTVIDHLVKSSWTCGVVQRVPSGEPDGTVRCLSRTVVLPAWRHDPPTPEQIAEVEALTQRLAALRAEGAPTETVREANMQVRRAALNLRVIERRSQTTEIPMEFQAMRLGPTALIGLPVEPFAEIGAGVKHRSPFATTFFSGYTNGTNFYLPTAPAYLEGGYEVWMAPFSPEVAGMVVEESVALLQELAG